MWEIGITPEGTNGVFWEEKHISLVETRETNKSKGTGTKKLERDKAWDFDLIRIGKIVWDDLEIEEETNSWELWLKGK